MGGIAQPLYFIVEGTEDLPKVTHQGVAELEPQVPQSPFGESHRPSRGSEKGESSTGNLGLTVLGTSREPPLSVPLVSPGE